jgi:hypothetical protein
MTSKGEHAMTKTLAPASPAAIGFLTSLVSSRQVPAWITNASVDAAAGKLDWKAVSKAIDTAKGCPFQAKTAHDLEMKKLAAESLELGYYLLDGSVYTIATSKLSGQRYAKVLVINEGEGKGRWEYAKGMLFKLNATMKLTLEAAAALGKQYGVCMICGRTLTDPSSVSAGIGPICAAKL